MFRLNLSVTRIILKGENMDTDMKWVVILCVLFIGVPLLGMGWSEHKRSECKLEAIKASMPADDITKVCGK